VSTVATPEQSLRRLQGFVVQYALPLWATAGFDEAAGGFHERLQFSGEPSRDVPRRLLVQARQIVVYSRAALVNWNSHGRALALRAFESVCQCYRSPDGNPGWIFSVDPNGRPKDNTRDLYTHAFVLYMLAWLYRLGKDASVLSIADNTLSDIDRILSSGRGPGFLSKVPGPTNLREQNPHMHLLEALLALAEATGKERYLARANTLVDLFDLALVDSATGTVREIFDEDWKPGRAVGENLVEPGHQMEWAWLLREWERLTGSLASERVDRLIDHAISYGIDRKKGLVRSIVQEKGSIVSGASRVWPQTEAIRALCREDASGKIWPNLVSSIMDRLFRAHLPSDLNGGWIDQIDQNGVPTVDYMPASTLYHLVGAAIDGASVFPAQAATFTLDTPPGCRANR
jgi:mannose/cellobiose epimerase-like protein (N-acyl-D-glucosamine 2-epimerase family)